MPSTVIIEYLRLCTLLKHFPTVLECRRINCFLFYFYRIPTIMQVYKINMPVINCPTPNFRPTIFGFVGNDFRYALLQFAFLSIIWSLLKHGTRIFGRQLRWFRRQLLIGYSRVSFVLDITIHLWALRYGQILLAKFHWFDIKKNISLFFFGKLLVFQPRCPKIGPTCNLLVM